jgi:hypothetical protein
MRRISRTSRNARREAVMRVFAVISLAISIASPLAAADKKPLTAKDLWTLQRVGNPVVSPDGKHHRILKGQNSKHWYGETLAWLGKYLR